MRSKMARYTMLNSMRQGGGNSRGEMRGEGGNMRGGMEMRNEMGYSEMRGGYSEMENRFRDRRGREHYDNGRFAPMRGEMNEEMEMRRGNQGGGNRGGGNRGGNQGGARNEYRMENYGGMEGRQEMRGEMRRDREGGGRSEMRGGWDDEEDGKVNQIGFDRPQEMNNHYPSRIDYSPCNEFERGSSPKMTGGAKGMEYGLDKETAEHWVHSMKNADGTDGEHWRVDQVKAIMSQKAIDRDPYEIYAIMNAMYSDYGKVLKKRGITTPDAYFEMALAFLDDPDAVPNKAMAYYEYIVRHE